MDVPKGIFELITRNIVFLTEKIKNQKLISYGKFLVALAQLLDQGLRLIIKQCDSRIINPLLSFLEVLLNIVISSND